MKNLLTALVESLQGQAMPSGWALFEANDGETWREPEPWPDRSHDNEYCEECRCVTNHTTRQHREAEEEGPQEP